MTTVAILEVGLLLGFVLGVFTLSLMQSGKG